jgi:two-component system, OmpR family, sensor histidine kinase KdpD
MGGTLTPEETPGGGRTMVVSLPAAGMAGDGGDSAAAAPLVAAEETALVTAEETAR